MVINGIDGWSEANNGGAEWSRYIEPEAEATINEAESRGAKVKRMLETMPVSQAPQTWTAIIPRGSGVGEEVYAGESVPERRRVHDQEKLLPIFPGERVRADVERWWRWGTANGQCRQRAGIPREEEKEAE